MARLLRPLREALQRANKRLPRFRQAVAGVPLVACCVYRSRNAAHVRTLIGQLPPGVDVRLHALDDVHDTLADRTLGQGRGARMPLLGSLVDAAPVPTDAWIVLFDDDAQFARRGTTRFFDVAVRAGFDIAQPAIDPGQPHSYSLTLVRFLSIARRSLMVEVGPVVAIAPTARDIVLPFPDWSTMGWGVDVQWADRARRAGLTLGIVDAEPVLHHGAIAAAYETSREAASFDRALRDAGISSIDELLKWPRPRWSLWRREPPWNPQS